MPDPLQDLWGESMIYLVSAGLILAGLVVAGLLIAAVRADRFIREVAGDD